MGSQKRDMKLQNSNQEVVAAHTMGFSSCNLCGKHCQSLAGLKSHMSARHIQIDQVAIRYI